MATELGRFSRIMVAGCCGSGKSVLSRRLAVRTGLPVVHLDREYWHPGWVETKAQAWREKMTTLVAADRWIMDGNYSGTWDIRLPRTELVIYLAYPLPLLFYRALKRTFRHLGRNRPDMTPGCPERFDAEFFHFVIACPLRHRRKHLDLLEGMRSDQSLLIFRSPRALERWLNGPA